MNIAEIEDDLLENMNFDIPVNVERAERFILAARQWLAIRPESASSQSQSMSLDKQYVNDMLQEAKAIVEANTPTASGANPNVRFLGVGSSFR